LFACSVNLIIPLNFSKSRLSNPRRAFALIFAKYEKMYFYLFMFCTFPTQAWQRKEAKIHAAKRSGTELPYAGQSKQQVEKRGFILPMQIFFREV